MELEASGFRIMVQGLEFRSYGLGIRAKGVLGHGGFKTWGLGQMKKALGFKALGLGLEV